MPTLLAIESSTSACSVAVLHQDTVVERFVVAPQDHTKRLLPMVDQLMVDCGLSLKQLDGIAYTAGPGSFTGLRICLGTVQGLAYGGDIPVIPVSTLAVMAHGVQREFAVSPEDLIVPCLDARMSEVYWGLFLSASSSGALATRLHADAISGPEEFLTNHLLPEVAFRSPRVFAIGSGWSLEKLKQASVEYFFETRSEYYPHAHDLALMAGEYLKDQPAIAIEDAQLTYIRNEVTWTKRKRIRE